MKGTVDIMIWCERFGESEDTAPTVSVYSDLAGDKDEGYFTTGYKSYLTGGVINWRS